MNRSHSLLLISGLLLALCLAPLRVLALVPQAEAVPAPRGTAPSATIPARRSPAVGEPLPRIVCPPGYDAVVYANGLESPDGLDFDPAGVLYVAEELAGRVSRVDADGTVTPLVEGLASPEGIAFDPAGNLYVVEDVEDGRLLRVDPDGNQTELASGLDAPEGVVWTPEGHLVVTQSNVEFAADVPWDVVTRVTRISADGAATDIVSDTVLFSYSAITLGADGLLYVANEASNVATADSVFRIEPATRGRTLLASELTQPEGLRFSPGGTFPLYVTEEDLTEGHGRLSRVQADGAQAPFCTGFYQIEDVAVDKAGDLYVSEDSRGLIVQILAPDQAPAPPRRLTVEPPAWTATNAFTLTWEVPFDRSGIAGAYVKIGPPPANVSDGTFYTGTELTQVAGLSVPGAGAHSVYVWLRDGAGNADPANAASATLGYDPDPPGSPIGLVADPGDWSPADSFTLAWDNPPEVSGVITACYRLDAPPIDTADSDACQGGADIQAIDGIPVFDSGQHRAYVWLVDAARNVDLTTGVSVTLRYDSLPPLSVAGAPATALTAPIQVTWVATDTHSGVRTVALWVRHGEGPWTDSGLSSPAGGPAFFLYEPAGAGIYYFATQAVDQAGNVEAVPTGEGDAQTRCLTRQRLYLPLLWRKGP